MILSLKSKIFSLEILPLLPFEQAQKSFLPSSLSLFSFFFFWKKKKKKKRKEKRKKRNYSGFSVSLFSISISVCTLSSGSYVWSTYSHMIGWYHCWFFVFFPLCIDIFTITSLSLWYQISEATLIIHSSRRQMLCVQ